MAGLPTVLIPNRFGGGGGVSPPFAISDTTGLQTALDSKEPTIATLALSKGGTNANLSATGGTGQVLKQKTVGGAIQVEALGATEISAALDAGSGTASQVVRGDGTISALVPGDMPALYKFRALWDNSQTITTTPAKLTLQTAAFNTIGSVSASVITVTNSGWYLVYATIYSATGNLISTRPYINGTIYSSSTDSPASSFPFGFVPIYINAGETLSWFGATAASSATIDSTISGINFVQVIGGWI